MTDVLEYMTKDSLYTADEVIENEITHLMVRMSDVAHLNSDEKIAEIIEDWRRDLVRIRNALSAVNSLTE